MTNEIKEIKIGMYTADEILKFMTNGEGRSFMGRSMYDAIIDYITNLQEEKENAVECLKYYEKKHFIKPAVDNTKLTIELYNAYLKEINDLQQRIDKATNYILENICCDTRVYTKNENVYKVVDILRGDE